mgnify:CR=1 FL=1
MKALSVFNDFFKRTEVLAITDHMALLINTKDIPTISELFKM